MQVTLTPHGEELLKDQLARHAGSSPEQILERALETLASEAPVLTPEEQERRRQAVDAMRAFGKKHHLALGPGERIQDLIHEGHRSEPRGLSPSGDSGRGFRC